MLFHIMIVMRVFIILKHLYVIFCLTSMFLYYVCILLAFSYFFRYLLYAFGPLSVSLCSECLQVDSILTCFTFVNTILCSCISLISKSLSSMTGNGCHIRYVNCIPVSQISRKPHCCNLQMGLLIQLDACYLQHW